MADPLRFDNPFCEGAPLWINGDFNGGADAADSALFAGGEDGGDDGSRWLCLVTWDDEWNLCNLSPSDARRLAAALLAWAGSPPAGDPPRD